MYSCIYLYVDSSLYTGRCRAREPVTFFFFGEVKKKKVGAMTPVELHMMLLH